jgi:hypothetical protein
VIKQAKARLKLLGAAKEDAELLSPGGKYDGRPVDYALAKYQFFACNKCWQPYFGGLKECGAAPQAAAAQGGVGGCRFECLVCGYCFKHVWQLNLVFLRLGSVAWSCASSEWKAHSRTRYCLSCVASSQPMSKAGRFGMIA